jgi:hypothetical protein
MVSQTALRRILDALTLLDAHPHIRAQAARATIGTITITVAGLFADLAVAGIAESAAGDAGKRGILGELHCDTPVGDAILHIEDGIIRYLEIWFYDTLDWGCVERATVY